MLHFDLADFPVPYQIMAVTLIVMDNTKNLRVFNFAILLESRKFEAREMYVFYSNCSETASCRMTVVAQDILTNEYISTAKRDRCLECCKSKKLNFNLFINKSQSEFS